MGRAQPSLGSTQSAGGSVGAAPPDVAEPLALVARLCRSLCDAKVRYCHWKSTQALERSARGENDLDLLVAAHDVPEFERILVTLGFKEVISSGPRKVPGVRHFFGLDHASGRLVDVHAHEQLVIGDDATKNYRLPIEDAYLGSSAQGELFMVPAPEFEFILLVIRLILKHGTPDTILTFRGSLSPTERRELEHLAERSDPAAIELVLHEHLPGVGPSMFEDCVRSLQPGAPLSSRIRTGHALRAKLASFARRSAPVDAWLQIWRRASRRFRRKVLHQGLDNRSATGGKVIALVGGDGAGKTSSVEEISRWLSGPFATATMHLGKPRRSFAWLAVRTAVHVGRAVRTGRRSGHVARSSDEEIPAARGYAWLVTGVLTARDRCRASRRARAFADHGGIVICDRYPLAQIVSMDGPRERELRPDLPLSVVVNRLAELERRYYRRIPSPDVVIVLKVTPETAVARRAGEDAEVVRARSEEIMRTSWDSIGAEIVDADRSPAEVLSQIKAHIWAVV